MGAQWSPEWKKGRDSLPEERKLGGSPPRCDDFCQVCKVMCAKGGRKCRWREEDDKRKKKRSQEMALYVQQLQRLVCLEHRGHPGQE